ncbi:esterase CG5412 [Culicoides brevitarsis]|uniref:esterase CG5412 n=1 Tax=Culicoides brevitarsis TaxID=469753 RepID=UPI00307B16F8
MPDCDTTTNASSSSSCGTIGSNEKNQKNDKLKVLALHGYRQTAESFKSKIGSFRKYLNKYVDFVFVTAPHIAPVEGDSGNSWWFNKDDGTFKGTNLDGPAIGFEKSLRLIEEVWETQGPFQGILGFSQGACFAGIICSLAVRSMTSINPRFALLASGFRSGSLVHRNAYEQKIQIPSLHIYGETDEIIPKEMSLALAECFDEPNVLSHSGGHYFPATANQKQIYIDFFQDQLQDYLEAKEIAEASLANMIELKTANNDESDNE